MKKLLLLICVIAFLFCGCHTSDTSDKQNIKINLPKDNTVNGYRIAEKETEGMPDKIDGAEIVVQENQNINSNKELSYCGNKNSKKFHKLTCGSLKNTKEENKIYLGSKQAFIDKGYSACKLCKP